MRQLVQAAIDAANAGQTAQAKQYLKQALTENPNDVDGWLVLAAIIEDPARKRQCLQRALSLDPTNQIARDELLEMDRAAMGGAPAPSIPARPVESNAPQPGSRQMDISRPLGGSPVPAQPQRASQSQSVYQPQPAPQPKPVAQSKPVPQPQPAAAPAAKVLKFHFPLWMRIILCGSAAGSVLFIPFAIMNPDMLMGVFIPLLFLYGAWMISVRVEVSNTGIRVAQLFGGGEIGWDEIARLESNTLKRRLTLFNKNGQKLHVTNQVSGYPQIIEILRQKRPDLFGMAAPASYYASSPYTGMGQQVTPAFTGSKVFKKSFFKRYASVIIGIIVIPIGLPGLWNNSTENLIGGIIFMLVGLYLILAPFFSIHQIKVEPGQLTIEATFNEDQFRPDQIANISMKTARGRRGSATNFVALQTAEGKTISLLGFDGGEEILYGTLVNWWNSQRK